nr:alcohol dehydrogenase catalytic domain-containing protein [Mycoplasmopsis bovis]
MLEFNETNSSKNESFCCNRTLKNEVYKEVDVPKPKYKEVLIEMETSGNLSYRLACKANYDWLVEPKYPLIPGHEGIGKVVALGEGCTTFENWW